METNSSMVHFPPSPPLALNYSPSIVKEEVPPLGVRPPMDTNLLAPPIVKPGDPSYGDESCQVEEEIPPSWQLEGTDKETIAASDDEKGKEEEAPHFANHLAEENLELLFDLGSDRTTKCIIKALSIKEWKLCSRSSWILQRNPGAQLADSDSP
jgi:hypothetical protein